MVRRAQSELYQRCRDRNPKLLFKMKLYNKIDGISKTFQIAKELVKTEYVYLVNNGFTGLKINRQVNRKKVKNETEVHGFHDDCWL